MAPMMSQLSYPCGNLYRTDLSRQCVGLGAVLGEEDLQELFTFEDRALAGLLQPVGEGLPTLGRDAS
jgi:hypothetical protein